MSDVIVLFPDAFICFRMVLKNKLILYYSVYSLNIASLLNLIRPNQSNDNRIKIHFSCNEYPTLPRVDKNILAQTRLHFQNYGQRRNQLRFRTRPGNIFVLKYSVSSAQDRDKSMLI